MTKAHSTRWSVCLSVMSWLTFCFRHCYFPRGRAYILGKINCAKEKPYKSVYYERFSGGFPKGKDPYRIVGRVTTYNKGGGGTYTYHWALNVQLKLDFGLHYCGLKCIKDVY